MRLVYKRPKYLRFSASVARRALRRRLKNKQEKLVIRRETRYLSRKSVQELYIRNRYEIVVGAGKSFSMLRSPDEVTRVLREYERAVVERKSIYLNMQNVQDIDYCAIAALFAVCRRVRRAGIRLNGNFPRDFKCNVRLQKSGFTDTLFSNLPEYGHRYDITADNQIFTLSKPELAVAKEIEEKVSLAIFGKKRKLEGLYSTIGELMDNTDRHASDTNESEKWWLSINIDREYKRAEFVFVDYGVGILANLHSKKNGNRIVRKLYREAVNKYGLEATDQQLKTIITRSAKAIVSLSGGHGQGIYSFYLANQRNQISSLHVVANDAFGNVTDNQYKKLNVGLRGTLYYWDICASN